MQERLIAHIADVKYRLHLRMLASLDASWGLPHHEIHSPETEDVARNDQGMGLVKHRTTCSALFPFLGLLTLQPGLVLRLIVVRAWHELFFVYTFCTADLGGNMCRHLAAPRCQD